MGCSNNIADAYEMINYSCPYSGWNVFPVLDSMLLLLFVFLIVCTCGLFKWQWICEGICCLLIFVLPLEIQLPEGGWGPVNRFNSATFLCLSYARTWNSKAICRGIFVFSWLRCEVAVTVALLILLELFAMTA